MKNENTNAIFKTFDQLFEKGFNLDILKYYEGFEAWKAYRLKEAGMTK